MAEEAADMACAKDPKLGPGEIELVNARWLRLQPPSCSLEISRVPRVQMLES